MALAKSTTASPEFRVFVADKKRGCKQGTNIREDVKKMWLFPRELKEHLPWRPVDNAQPIISISEALFSGEICPPKMALEKTKLYVMLDGFVPTLWACRPELAGTVPGATLVPNTEKSHISLVSSGLISKLDPVKMEAFIKEQKIGRLDIQVPFFPLLLPVLTCWMW